MSIKNLRPLSSINFRYPYNMGASSVVQNEWSDLFVLASNKIEIYSMAIYQANDEAAAKDIEVTVKIDFINAGDSIITVPSSESMVLQFTNDGQVIGVVSGVAGCNELHLMFRRKTIKTDTGYLTDGIPLKCRRIWVRGRMISAPGTSQVYGIRVVYGEASL